jgi:DNA-binding FadR family transcriptional regulator
VLSAAPGEALTRLIRMHVLVASVGSEDLVNARITLERESARLAAANAGPEDFTDLADLLALMEGPGATAETFNDADTAFHVAIARASGNSLVAELTTALRNAMRATLLTRLRDAEDLAAVAVRLSEEHRAIFEALKAGEGDLASNLVAAHIAGFYRG